ncbi:MAG: response regulator [Magnetovibrionaceae bacterium]
MAGYNLERLNFLVVDDNRHMRHLVKTILHALGVRQVAEAEDGAEALRELKSFPADIVICDWNMEPLDGMDFLRLVRTGSDSPNPYVPVVMLTGHTELSRVEEARDSGVNEFLAKPISAKALYSRIRALIDRQREFVRTKRYFGPCRRRRDVDYKGQDRRKPADGGLSQDEVEALLNG